MIKKILCLLVLLCLSIVPVNAETVLEYTWPNGNPSAIAPANSGPFLMTPSYTNGTEAGALFCSGTTPQVRGYQRFVYTGAWYNEGLGEAINGSRSYSSITSKTPYSWDTSGTVTFVTERLTCQDAGNNNWRIWDFASVPRSDRMFNFTSAPDFVGSPLTGSAPLSVSFSVSNLTNKTGLVWSFGDGNITTATGTPIGHIYQNQGTYSVRLDYMNGSAPAYIQKNNYITVGAPNATKTKWFQTIDGTNGNIVLNSSIQLQDIENSSWVNATGLTADGMSSITTLEGHHINAYAQALGYSDSDDLNILNDGTPSYIMMWPTFAKNVSTGNVSLYVTVKDKDTKANIVGAGVTASLASGSMSTTTNEAGIAYFVVKNSSMVLITAQAIGQGYQTATTTINTGTASGGSASAAATILLGKNTVIPTFTTSVTTLPGGGTPTPITTILPGCEDQISAAGQEKCRAAQSNQGLSFLSGNLLGLIQICFVVTILYLLGIKLGK